MFFLGDHENKYPSCTRFIKSELQRNFLKTARIRVFDAFEKACESTRFAKVALEYGNDPFISEFAGTDDPNSIAGDCGMNNPLAPNNILVRNVIFAAFESGYDRDFTKHHLEATILHELVHWVRAKAGLNSALRDPKIVGDEAGEIFEIWAYDELVCTPKNRARLNAAAMKGTIQQVVDAVTTVGPPPFRLPL